MPSPLSQQQNKPLKSQPYLGLVHSTHSESKPVISERFIKSLMSKIYKKMTVNNSKSYLSIFA